LVQSLRDANVKMRLAPSDEIYSTPDTVASSDDLRLSEKERPQTRVYSDDAAHPAEQIPLLPSNHPPQKREFEVIGSLSASCTLRSRAAEAEESEEYMDALEALSKELQYKAYSKKADFIFQFSASLNDLGAPDFYRLLVLGVAGRYLKKVTDHDPEKTKTIEFDLT